ncbi:hypothetical protein LG329_04525 [Virgibacillus necropolis]|uniref:hypothetical protein n=1 Tax=Virgibacillus necropolis TaxID=163877 RepID=UPI00384D1A5F
MKKYINNESGSTHLVMIVILLASVFLCFIFFDLFTGFMNKRVSQSSADASVLAASTEMKDAYEDELLEDIKEELDKLEEEVDKKLEEDLEEEGEDEGNGEEQENSEPDEDELKDIYQKILEGIYDEDPPEGLVEWLIDNEYELNPNKILTYIFEEDEINSKICSAINNNRNEIKEAAQYYADKNGAEGEIELKFPYEDEFKVFVKVKTEASFSTVDASQMGENNDVYAEASAQVKSPVGVDIDCD